MFPYESVNGKDKTLKKTNRIDIAKRKEKKYLKYQRWQKKKKIRSHRKREEKKVKMKGRLF